LHIYFEWTPPPEIKVDAVRLTLLNGIRKFGTKVKKRYRETTRTWRTKPKFETVVSLKGVGGRKGPTAIVYTDSQIYAWVDYGTGQAAGNRADRYPIWAGYYTGKSDKKVLAFPSVFEPKTTPGVIGSTSGFKGDVDTFTPYVLHPGIEPRRFTEIISEEMDPVFTEDMKIAMKEAAKNSGWGR
jgi:hypothetical protein